LAIFIGVSLEGLIGMMENLLLELVKEIKKRFILDFKEPFLLLLAIINDFLEKRKLRRVIIVGGIPLSFILG